MKTTYIIKVTKKKDDLKNENDLKQAGAELGQAQLKLELGFTVEVIVFAPIKYLKNKQKICA